MFLNFQLLKRNIVERLGSGSDDALPIKVGACIFQICIRDNNDDNVFSDA